jgi:hypothetical protein
VDVSGIRIALTCEDQAHRALATFLADRVIVDEAAKRGSSDWLNEESLAWLRTFSGLNEPPGTPDHERYYPHKHARRDIEEQGRRPLIGGWPVKLSGHINGKPLKPAATFWRNVFMLFAAQDGPPDALIVVHDTDGDRWRLDGMEQALELVESLDQPMPVLVATPHQDAEAWFVAGFDPLDETERRRLDQVTEQLSFCPPREPQRLTAHPNDARTDAKRVLRMLVLGGDESRPPSLDELPDLCQRTLTDLDRLQQRGGACLLAAYLRTIRERLVPLFIPETGPGRRG